MILSDGATIAVEVTRHNRPTSLAILAELDRRDWRFTSLRSDWVVDMIPSYRVESVHRKIAEPLAALESAAVDSLLLRASVLDEPSEDRLDSNERAERRKLERPGVRQAGQRLYALGACLVYQLGKAEGGAGFVIMGESSQAGATGPSIIVQLVQRHAAFPDNVATLSRASDRAERHLFVWVESSQQPAVAAFGFGADFPHGEGLPEVAPRLPDCIDAVWAATAYEDADIWRYHRQEGWRDLGTWRSPE